MRRISSLALMVPLVVLIAGCPNGYVDKDPGPDEALLLPEVPGFKDPDGLDVEKGDKVDWKYVNAGRDGTAKLKVEVGKLFEQKMGITGGSLRVLGPFRTEVTSVKMVPPQQEYTLEWPVKKGTRYFIAITADGGKAGYRMTLEFSEAGCGDCGEPNKCIRDVCVKPQTLFPPEPVPCSRSCSSRKVCVQRAGGEAECVRKDLDALCVQECHRIFKVTREYISKNYQSEPPAQKAMLAVFDATESTNKSECITKCKDEQYGIDCLATTVRTSLIPECKPPCEGRCPAHKCNEATGQCVRDPCKGVRCPSGQKCRRGKCYKPPPPPCGGACPAGKTCNKKTGKCEKDTDKPPPPISCGVVDVRGSGPGSLVTLNRGTRHGVQVGDSGSIKGAGSFKIKKVFPTRSQAFIKKDPVQLENKRNCTIKRRPKK